MLMTLFAVSTLSLSCGSSNPGGSDVCSQLTGYTSSATTAPSFATDIYPILTNTSAPNGCSQAVICHGTPPFGLDTATGTQTLEFDLPSPANVKTALLAASVNAPTMKRVVPGSVGTSLMAYKISGQSALACANLSCVAGASVGGHRPCGDAMPTGGTISDADRTKILDWIAKGAAD
jgi:hypothetical protein